MRRPPAVQVAVLAVVIAGLSVWAGLSIALEGTPGTAGSSAPTAGDFRFVNATAWLGSTFVHGAPQAFGFNGDATWVTGVVGNPGPTSVPYPLLGGLGSPYGGPTPSNLSANVAQLFHAGDTLGIGWNGSSWLITGEAAWGSVASGALAAYSDGQWTNLTPLIAPYFGGNGGVWFDAWNGTAWLLGGGSNNVTGVLVSLQGSTVHNLTPLIPDNSANTWIQCLAWNGSAWLVGGHGIFGALDGNRYTNLLPGSEFTDGGLYAADWNGTEWLVGGGEPAVVEFLRGSDLVPGPPLAPSFSDWVNSIVWDGRGWYIAGAGTASSQARFPGLEYLDASSGVLVNLAGQLPSEFGQGEIQFGGPAPFAPIGTILFLGQGGLTATKPGPSHGAAVTVARL